MILPDANLFIYAYNYGAPESKKANQWLVETFSSSELIGLNWQVITAFLRITTSPRVFARPFSAKEASFIVGEWLEKPQVQILTPTESHWEIFRSLLVKEQVTGNLVMDAHLAALAIEHGATIATTDRDFSRFSKLKVIYPLD
jgi:toxin-antitoxin system PIN domain toxin